MRLKSLEMFGFKSFVDKTIINFDEGISAIVGPNGSGKSNCVDAIRWAMGEQSAKHLRGSQMQDVIFNGNDKKPAMGMARVALTFEIKDGFAPAGYAGYSEIEVERRLYRSGESEYYINKVPSRLRDIIDLFLGTGVGTRAYSIIEQGRVDQILSAKPEQRRSLIEEAAGISKFKSRKEAALRKMESTQNNLGRLRDVITELDRQLNSLNRQAKKAERYKEIFDELRDRELRYSRFKYGQWKEELTAIEKTHAEREETKTGLEASLSESETRVEEDRLSLTGLEQELNRVQESYYKVQNAIKLHETTIEYQNSKIKDTEEQMKKDAIDLEVCKEKLKSCRAELEQLNEQQVSQDVVVAGAKEKVEEMTALFEQADKTCAEWQEKAHATNRAILECVSQIAEMQSRLEYLGKKEVEISGQTGKAQAEVAATDHVAQELQRKIEQADLAIRTMQANSTTLSGTVERLKTELNQKRLELDRAINELQTKRGELSEKVSIKNSLLEIQKNREGFGDGVRTVLKAAQDRLHGIRGTVSDMLDTEPDFETAVGAVLGDKLQYVVVQSKEAGVDAVQHLRQQASGRSTFIPLDVRQFAGEQRTVAQKGVIGPMVNMVRFSDDFQKVAHFLFSDCLLVEDLQSALHLSQGDLRDQTLVTLTGEVIDRTGLVSGGQKSFEESILSQKRKIQKLDQEIAEARVFVSTGEERVAAVRHEVEELTHKLEETSRDYHGEEIRFVHQQKDASRFRDDLARANQDRDRYSLEIARLLEEKQEMEKEKQTTAADLETFVTKQQSLEGNFREAQEKLESMIKERDRASQSAVEAKMKLTQAEEAARLREKEMERAMQTKLELETKIEETRHDLQKCQTEIQSLKESNEKERIELESSLQEIDRVKEEQETLRAKHEAVTQTLQTKELGLREKRKEIQKIVAELHANELTQAEKTNQIRHLSEQIRERYKEELAQLPLLENAAVFNEAEEAEWVTTMRDRIDKIGSVHVGAIDEYNELKTRHEFLTKQEIDLNQSLEDLKKAIHRLNRISKDRFIETFHKVNERFEELFPRLFKGGKASLVLTDEQNLMETGVEIFAQPPGKKLQSMTLLSGGEKALTAVALIFSIFLIKPSPFCLLDEVDAPLDDVNVERFSDMIRDFTDYSQFIVITHNKQTMERADCLYGVTMQEAGVSKIVSVRLNQKQEPLPQVA